MHRTKVLAVVVLFGCGSPPPNTAPVSDPIGRAFAGQMQCYSPNVARRTCQSLAGYRRSADGSIDNDATVLISSSPVIVMTTRSPVTVRSNSVCGPIRRQDIEAATFELDGQAADATQTADLRVRMIAAERSLIGREICTQYLPHGDTLLARASVDGVVQPSLDQTVIWVGANSGWRVHP